MHSYSEGHRQTVGRPTVQLSVSLCLCLFITISCQSLIESYTVDAGALSFHVFVLIRRR